jgi:hypothetical protein
MVLKHLKGDLDAIPGNIPQVLDQATTYIVFDRIQGDRLQPQVAKVMDPPRTGGVMRHRNQAGSIPHTGEILLAWVT